MIHHGNCHCGDYRFTFLVDDGHELQSTIARCNCRLCGKLGSIWLQAPDEAVEETRKGRDLSEYSTESIRYKFCSICGTGIYAEHFDGPLAGQRLTNARALRGIDAFDLEEGEEAKKKKNKVPLAPTVGSCHCGRIGVEVLGPLEDVPIKECDCSICTRIAWVGVYANKARVRLTGTEHAREYRFGRMFTGHPFCATCGGHVYMNLYGPPQDAVDKFSEERKAGVRAMLDLKPVNVRCLDGVDLGALAIERNVEGTDGYERDVLGLVD